jgi:hypothetical protein
MAGEPGSRANPDILSHPEAYAPFPYRRDRLTFMRMDGRHLEFADATFDIAYSLSSIEHFGGMEGAVATLREMTRVLKPGGVLALATEYVLDGPPHEETFRPDEFPHSISGLRLVRRWISMSTAAAGGLADSCESHQTPRAGRFNDTVFTTVVFLRKSEAKGQRQGSKANDPLKPLVQALCLLPCPLPSLQHRRNLSNAPGSVIGRPIDQVQWPSLDCVVIRYAVSVAARTATAGTANVVIFSGSSTVDTSSPPSETKSSTNRVSPDHEMIDWAFRARMISTRPDEIHMPGGSGARV